MNSRELAREYFKNNNLSYEDIEMPEIYKLIQILNKKISDAESCMIMINEPKLRGRNANIKLNKNGKIKFAEIRVKGSYFNDREAITFNENGWIGFCEWADGYNLTPFIMAFKDWCDYLTSKKATVKNKMTKEKFIKQRMEIDKVTREYFDKNYIVIECTCGKSYCDGWRCLTKYDVDVDLFSYIKKIENEKQQFIKFLEDKVKKCQYKKGAFSEELCYWTGREKSYQEVLDFVRGDK